eukprot:COSAG01_NODE_1331_length_10699_cov_28.574717_9_plen_608_part_00
MRCASPGLSSINSTGFGWARSARRAAARRRRGRAAAAVVRRRPATTRPTTTRLRRTWGAGGCAAMPATAMLLLLLPSLMTIMTTAAAQKTMEPPALPVGTTRQLFVDGSLLVDHAKTTAIREVRSFDGGDDPHVVLRADLPWEHGKSLGHASVQYDVVDRKVKLWYALADNCGIKCDSKIGEEDGMLAYAESSDGLHFTKPNLGIINNTNLVGHNTAGASVFINADPAAHPSERFVSVGKCHGGPLCPNPWAWTSSPDGIHWPQNATTDSTDRPSTCQVNKAVDTHATAFWDPNIREYVAYTRDRYGSTSEPRGIRRVRRVSAKNISPLGVDYAVDDCPWGNSTVVIDIDARDNATHPTHHDSYNSIFPVMDIYGAMVWPQDMGGGATMYWAFPWRFWHFLKHAGPATYDVTLMASIDGLNFSYVNDRRPFVRTGRDGTSGSRRVTILNNPIIIDDTILFYMLLTNQAEMKDPNSGTFNVTDGRPIEAAFGVVRMRLDGFVSMASRTYSEEAVVSTLLLEVGAGKLYLNVDSINGQIRVAILAADGSKPLLGYGVNDSVPISANTVSVRCEWDNNHIRGVQPIKAGMRLRLQFYLLEAKLYSFQWRP